MRWASILGLMTSAAVVGFWIKNVDAGPTPQGSVIVRIDDGVGNGRCIGSADKLTATLRRVVLEKRSRWLGLIEDSELGITMTTTVSGSSSDDQQSASFAKAVKEPVDQYGTGQVSLAQEQNLLSQFALTKDINKFTVVDIEVGIVRTEGKSVGAQIILGAVNATKSLSMPANPFTTAFNVATTYVNNVFEPLLDQAASQKEAVSHHIVMNINSADCNGDDEKTGTKAIIDAADDPAQPGYIDTGKINSYCFTAELKPAFVLKYAPLPASKNCRDVANFYDLRNSYMAFYVNALPAEKPRLDRNIDASLFSSLGWQPPSGLSNALFEHGLTRDTADRFAKVLSSNQDATQIAKAFRVSASDVEAYREALQRCDANGISPEQCLE